MMRLAVEETWKPETPPPVSSIAIRRLLPRCLALNLSTVLWKKTQMHPPPPTD
eukprot:Gb_06630 [translate_table: standard]